MSYEDHWADPENAARVAAYYAKQEAHKRSIWTVTLDYYATGEGRAVMGLFCYVDHDTIPGELQAREIFAKTFDPYFARAAILERGIVVNDVIRLLFSKSLIDEIRRAEGKANIDVHAKMYVNYS